MHREIYSLRRKCPACGYDFQGLPRNGARCPECGLWLGPAQVVHAMRRVRRRMRLSLVLFLVAPVVAIVPAVVLGLAGGEAFAFLGAIVPTTAAAIWMLRCSGGLLARPAWSYCLFLAPLLSLLYTFIFAIAIGIGLEGLRLLAQLLIG